jgi:hypothetical protein
MLLRLVDAAAGQAALVIAPPARLSTITGLSNQVIAGLAP